MKKVSLVIFGIIISAALAFGLIKYSKYTLNEFKGKTYSLSITKFKGKIMQTDYAHFSGSIIGITMDEALKSGENSILCYNDKGVEIWNPGTTPPVINTYAAIKSIDDGLFRLSRYDTQVSKEKIIVNEMPTVFNYIALVLGFLIILVITLAAILRTFIELVE
jgi:hypothetical protein